MDNVYHTILLFLNFVIKTVIAHTIRECAIFSLAYNIDTMKIN